MPWSNQSDFNKSTTGKRVAAHFRKNGGKVPSGKLRQFRKVVNSMLARGYSEKRAIKAAWAAIKRS